MKKRKKDKLVAEDVKLDTAPGDKLPHGLAQKKSRKQQDEEPPPPTLSIAVAASVIDNTQSAEQATAVAGHIARTAAIFNVDEVVVIDDSGSPGDGIGPGAALLARILQFMETPQYLRKALMPMHKDLRLAGQLPPLDAPHHMRAHEWGPFREGVVLRSAHGAGSILNIGLDKNAYVKEVLRPGVRATLEMGLEQTWIKLDKGPLVSKRQQAHLQGRVVLPGEPRARSGTYWGYSVRIASGLSEALSASPYEGGYDLKIGTSDGGSVQGACELRLPAHRHLIIAFGGPTGLEDCQSNDTEKVSEDVSALFDHWLNTCPKQGSRTIRTEEALLISLSYFQPALQKAATRSF